MAEYIIQGSSLTELADAIRGKIGKSDNLSIRQMVAAITEMESGGSQNNKLTQVNIIEDTNTYTLTFDNGDIITGVVEFDEFGLPVSVADDAGNRVDFLDNQPSAATSNDGHSVPIVWG
jgi:hypothetical protein